MARLTKNNCDYFSHDADMRKDPKVKAVRAKFKKIGYPIWCMLLEYLTGADGNEFEYSDLEFELIAGDFEDFSVTEIRDVVDYCIYLEMLFIKNGFIHSENLDKRLMPVYKKRGIAKQISKKQSRKNGKFVSDKPNDLAFLSQDDTEMPQSKVNQIKGKETKGKETNISEASSLFSECNEIYNNFCLLRIGVKGEFDKLQGKSMNGIIELLRANVKDKSGSNQIILDSWRYILDNFDCWEKFHQENIKLNQIRSNLLNIMIAIKRSSKRTTQQTNQDRQSIIINQLQNEESIS